jgi:hypothetical protein
MLTTVAGVLAVSYACVVWQTSQSTSDSLQHPSSRETTQNNMHTCCTSRPASVLFCHAAALPAGRTTSTHCMAYLDSGYVFLGSKGGDSQLIKLHAEPLPAPTATTANLTASPAGDDDAAETAAAAAGLSGAAGGAGNAAAAGGAADEGPNHVEVVEAWPSLAPIVDFVVMDLERQGQGQVGLRFSRVVYFCRCVEQSNLHSGICLVAVTFATHIATHLPTCRRVMSSTGQLVPLL